MHSKTEEIINEYIDVIDEGDFSTVFFAAITEANGYWMANIVTDLYDAFMQIGISDEDIISSESNNFKLCDNYENIWKRSSKPGTLKVLSAYELVDNNTYFTACCLYKLNGKLSFRSIDTTIDLQNPINYRKEFAESFSAELPY